MNGWGLLPVLLALVALPFPLRGIQQPEWTVPVLWLLLGAVGASCVWLWRWWPAWAALCAWAILRLLVTPSLRGMEVVALLLAASSIGRLASTGPRSCDRIAAGAILTAASVNALLGLGQMAGWWLPGMWVQPGYERLPQGLLAHPNHWGLSLAFALPLWGRILASSRLRWPCLLAWALLILFSRSRIAVAVALVGLLGLAWSAIAPRWRGRLVLAGLGALLTVTALRSAYFGGMLLDWGYRSRLIGEGRWLRALTVGLPWDLWDRAPVWQLGATMWASSWRTLLIGWGPGSWLIWSLMPGGLSATLHGTAQRWTEAHSEPLQLGFELGLVGLALGAWLLAGALHAGVLAWRIGDPWARTWILVAAQAALALWVTPVFHHPALAVTAVWAVGRMTRREKVV